jgi:hypothetical protein
LLRIASDSACRVDPVDKPKCNWINCVRGGRRYSLQAQGDFCGTASRHFCPHTGCDYRGWLGLGNVRANGHPNSGPWRQLHCTACEGYFPEHHGTIFHGKQASVELRGYPEI